MTENATRTGLVTGASSGLGFEASAQLAEQGYGRVIITARTQAKAEEARRPRNTVGFRRVPRSPAKKYLSEWEYS